MGDSSKIHRGFLLIAIILSMSIALSFQRSFCSSTKCSSNCDSGNQCDCCTNNQKRCTQDETNCCTGNCCTQNKANCCSTQNCCTENRANCCSQNCCTENKANCCSQNCCTENKANCCTQNQIIVHNQTNCANLIAPQPIAPNVSVVNVNNGTFEAELSVNNNVSIVNNIHIPINVQNINDVQVVIESESILESEKNVESIVKDTRESHNNTIVVTKPVPVLIPMPTVKKSIVPYPLPIRNPLPTPPSSCCYCMNSAQIYLNQPMQQICGEQCTSPYMYIPQNPCTNGCRRLNFCLYWNCGRPSCSLAFQDCNLCGDEFYRTYEGFARCSGCFVQ